jgi:hypothetical protein
VPNSPPKPTHFIFFGEWRSYNMILSYYLPFNKSCPKFGDFLRILQHYTFVNLGHSWELPILAAQIQNFDKTLPINIRPDNHFFLNAEDQK